MPSSLLRLCCVIEDENLVFLVDVPAQADVVDLKKKIQSERALDTLQGVGPHILELWKVCIVDEWQCEVMWLSLPPIWPRDINAIAAKRVDALPERIKSMGAILEILVLFLCLGISLLLHLCAVE